MSGVLKSIKKVFKPVVKVLKKIALPALAIGAVVLTGGAALGVLPSLGALGSSLGLSGALTGVLGMAAKGATFGALGALVTGKNPLKGATSGLRIGGITGGIGALANPAAAAASGGGAATSAHEGIHAASSTGNSVADVMTRLGPEINSQAAIEAGGVAVPGAGIGAGASAIPLAAAPQVAQVASTGGGGGGILGFLNKNPILGGQIIQGIGAGIAQNDANKQARYRTDQIRSNYDGIGDTLYKAPTSGVSSDAPIAADRYDPAVYRVSYNPKTKRIERGGG